MARSVPLVVGALVSLVAALPLEAQSVQPCPVAQSCAQLSIGGGMLNATVRVPLSLTQGPNDSQLGGIDELAAVALTLRLGDGSGTPLRLADCTLGANGLPAAIKPDPSIAAFNVVIENLACTGGRTHCLCPDPVSGITPDNYINLAIYGPNPLPTPGMGMIDIPILPDGQLLTIDLASGPAASGTIPLHVLTQWTDTGHPASTAFLSVGDRLRVDQTCMPIPPTPPCSSAQSVSQIVTTDGSVVIAGTPTSVPTQTATPTSTPSNTATQTATATATHTATATATHTATATTTHTATATATATLTATPIASATDTPTPSVTAGTTPSATPVVCLGDCDHSGVVTVDEILTMVNISLGSAQSSACPAGDANGDQQITIDEILTAVRNASNGCPGSP